MISLIHILKEGKYDSIVNELGKKIFKTIHKSYIYYIKNKKDIFKSFLYPIINNEKIKVIFNITRNIELRNEYFINGETVPYRNSSLIIINLELNPNYEPKVYTSVSHEIANVLRHEIEHVTQNQENAETKDHGINISKSILKQLHRQFYDKIDEEYYDYFLQSDEIPAFVSGFYLKAKRLKVPIDILMGDFLDMFIVDNRIDIKQKENILIHWTKYIVKHYKSAIFSQ